MMFTLSYTLKSSDVLISFHNHFSQENKHICHLWKLLDSHDKKKKKRGSNKDQWD